MVFLTFLVGLLGTLIYFGERLRKKYKTLKPSDGFFNQAIINEHFIVLLLGAGSALLIFFKFATPTLGSFLLGVTIASFALSGLFPAFYAIIWFWKTKGTNAKNKG